MIRNRLYSFFDAGLIRLGMLTSGLTARFSMWFQGCRVGRNFRSSGPVRVKARSSESIVIGNHVSLLGGWRSNRVGLTGPVLLQTWEGGKIEIGDHTGASAVVISSRSGVTIGEHCNIGGNVRIFDHDFHDLDPDARRRDGGCETSATSPVVIGDDVFIGTQAIVLKGVSIGDRSVIGAGSVVSKSIPSDCIAAGNPARVIRKLDPQG